MQFKTAIFILCCAIIFSVLMLDMRIWQVRGGSVRNESIGSKLMRLDEASNVGILKEKSNKRGDKDMTTILCQL